MLEFRGLRLLTLFASVTVSIQACNTGTTGSQHSSQTLSPNKIENITATITQADSTKKANTDANEKSKAEEVEQSREKESKLSDLVKGLSPSDGDSGLLLGFDTDTSQHREGYAQFYDYEKPDFSKTETNQTIYLTRIDDQIELAARLNYIASPQAQAFKYLGQVRYLEKPRVESCVHGECIVGSDYSRIWVANSQQEISQAQESLANEIKATLDQQFEELGVSSQDVTDYEKISFISDGFYIIEGFRSRITGGAAWFTARTSNFLVPLSNTTLTSYLRDLYTSDEIVSAFGSPKHQGWHTPVDVVEVSTFTLARLEGQTRILGMIETDGNAHRSFHQSFVMRLASERLVRYDNPIVDFEQFKSVYPDIIDLFISPNQNTIFILTQDELIGIDVPTATQIYSMTHDLSFNKVVMVEWATNNYVSRWEKELTH